MPAESNSENCQLKGWGGRLVALQSVHAHGDLCGVLLRMRIRQVYRNTTDQNIEAVYTFPMAWGCTLLGLSVELNGRKLRGRVVGKVEAEEAYEQAIDDGDLPVMVEWAGKDLYTASIGNLMSGDEAVIEMEYGQLLSVRDGQLRMVMPCTLAPRYEDRPDFKQRVSHHVYRLNPLAEYRFHLTLNISGPFAAAPVSSPTHAIDTVRDGETLAVRLNQKAFLDRDFVLNIEHQGETAIAAMAPDPVETGRYVVLTSYVPDQGAVQALQAQTFAPVRLKILVDCSGSMAGDSIAQARIALSALARELGPADCISFSRFGNQTTNIFGTLAPCTPAYLAEIQDEIHRLDANMGGTELQKALRRVLVIKDHLQATPPDVAILLITDGGVWNIEGMVATVREAGHRVFAIGVGSAPAESLLQELAAVTGGECVMVTPRENMKTCVEAVLRKIRTSVAIDIAIEFDEPAQSQQTLPIQTAPGCTVHRWTTLAACPTHPPHIAWSSRVGHQHQSGIQAQWVTPPTPDLLGRLLGAQQVLDCTQESEVLALGLRHQLVTRFTNLVLVHERTAADKPGQLPELQQIEHMMPVGWRGATTAHFAESPAFLRKVADGPMDHEFSRASPWRGQVRFRNGADGQAAAPLFATLAQAISQPAHPENPVRRAVNALNDKALGCNNFGEAWQFARNANLENLLQALINQLSQSCPLTRLEVWALFFQWLASQKSGDLQATRFARRLIRGELSRVPPSTCQQVYDRLDQELASGLPAIQVQPDLEPQPIPRFLVRQDG